MKLKRFNTGKENISTHFSCADEALLEVKKLFFKEQLSEEDILIELYSPNGNEITPVSQNRLNIDRVYSKRQIRKKCVLGRFRFVDSYKYQKDYSIRTILSIKNEQRRLGVEFKGYFILSEKKAFYKSRRKEPMLFVAVGHNTYYLLNDFISTEEKNVGIHLFKNISRWIQKRTFLKMFFK